MIPCPKCEADNMVGAIFCRACGEKLNLDELRPESFKNEKESLKKNAKAVVARLVKITTALLLILVLGLLLLPAGGFRSDYSLPASDLAKARSRLRSLQNTRRGSRQFSFTTEEINLVLNDRLDFSDGAAGGTSPQAPAPATEGGEGDSGGAAPAAESKSMLTAEYLNIVPLSGGYVKFILKSKFYGKLPLYTTVVGRFAVDEVDGGLKFYLSSAKAGKFPMFSKLKDIPFRRLETVTQKLDDLRKVAPYIKTFESDGTSVSVTVGS